MKSKMLSLLFLPMVAVPVAGQVAEEEASESAAVVQEVAYIGSEICQACHFESVTAWQGTSMARVFMTGRNELESRACESCHGPGTDHVLGGGDATKILRFGEQSPATIEEQNEACLQCHEDGGQFHWDGSVHEMREVACVQCHTVMSTASPESLLAQPTVADVCTQCHVQRAAQSQLSSHMPAREGKITCTDCHNPHGSTGPSLLVENSVNEVCFVCHAERRGPFLWEHAPVTESCLNCHASHGSINDNMLLVRAPRLCQSCHIESLHPAVPQSPASMFTFNRSCTNCHSQIHGSNHPSGARFQR